MPLLNSLPTKNIKQRLADEGVDFKVGPFAINLHSKIPLVAENLTLLYGEYPLLEKPACADFIIKLDSPSLARRWIRPQVSFSFDGHLPFKPLPINQAFAMFEWGLNWCVANNAHQYLVIHAAVVEKNGKVIIFPGEPGSGKSTLCAALVMAGWRLFSDEMALVSLKDQSITPIPRPISLKNASIEIIQSRSPDAAMGKPIQGTAKGTVAHLIPPGNSIKNSDVTSKAAAVVFPKYRQGSSTALSPLSKGRTFITLAQNSFNYHVLGPHAFDTLTTLIDGCNCYDFTYQKLDEALTVFENLIHD